MGKMAKWLILQTYFQIKPTFAKTRYKEAKNRTTRKTPLVSAFTAHVHHGTRCADCTRYAPGCLSFYPTKNLSSVVGYPVKRSPLLERLLAFSPPILETSFPLCTSCASNQFPHHIDI